MVVRSQMNKTSGRHHHDIHRSVYPNLETITKQTLSKQSQSKHYPTEYQQEIALS